MFVWLGPFDAGCLSPASKACVVQRHDTEMICESCFATLHMGSVRWCTAASQSRHSARRALKFVSYSVIAIIVVQ